MQPSTPPTPSSAPAAARPSWLARLKEADAKRPDLPGEHAVVLGAGVLLLLMSTRRRSLIGKLLTAGAGGALVGRAASGTGGIARVARVVADVSARLPRR